MTQEVINKFFATPLGQQLSVLHTTSDDRVFIRPEDAERHAVGKLDEDTSPLKDKTVLSWHPKYEQKHQGKLNLQNLVSLALKNGGATYSINTGEGAPKTGYMVSIEGYERVLNDHTLTDSVVAEYIKKHSAKLSEDNVYFGIWRDGNSWFLDCSINIKRLQDAVYFAVANNQRAIYDCEYNENITIINNFTKQNKAIGS